MAGDRHSERREHDRLDLNMVVQIRATDMEQFLDEYALNISSGGMFIRTKKPHPVGSMIYLQFQLSDGLKLIEGLGEVVHINDADNPVPGMGVEFVNLDEDSQALIDEIIRTRYEELS